MKINNDSKMAFQRNILVRNISLEKGGDIGHLAVACAQKAGLYKGEAISALGTQIGKNNFLIIDPETKTGQLFALIRDIKFLHFNTHIDSQVQEKVTQKYDAAEKIILKSAKKINYEG